MSKLTDYGFVVLTRFSQHEHAELVNARDLAEEAGLPLPTVSKLLKLLTRNGILQAHRGAKGGYSLSRDSRLISAADVIEALEGPIAFTDCTSPDAAGDCTIEDHCPNKAHWRRITHVVRDALQQVSLAELATTGGNDERKRATAAHNALTATATTSACAGGGCSGDGPACTCDHDLKRIGSMTRGQTK